MSEWMCSQSKCRRKDEHIAELKAELEKYVLKESGWVAYDIRVQSELQSKEQELAELREAAQEKINADIDCWAANNLHEHAISNKRNELAHDKLSALLQEKGE